jgi:hypothetical protein
MADDLNQIINDHDYRLRALEGKTISPNVISRLLPAGGADGDILAKSSADDYETEWVAPVYSQTVYYTTAGTDSFTKATYPNIKAVKVRVIGGGAGGGGAATTITGRWAGGGGGGGGGYAEKYILASALGTTETVTVGAGGNAGSAGNNNGSSGGTSSFGSHCSATGGSGGDGSAATTNVFGSDGGVGGTGTGGDINMPGQRGGEGFTIGNSGGNFFRAAIAGAGGDSVIGVGATNRGTPSALTGASGSVYGGGGEGGVTTEGETTARAGGAGASGIVIVDIFV